MLKETDIAKLMSVSFDSQTKDVFITFKVIDDDYRDYVLRWAKQEEGRLKIKGDTLSIVETDNTGKMRQAPGKGK